MLQPITSSNSLESSSIEILSQLMKRVRECYPEAYITYIRKKESGLHHIEVYLNSQEYEIVELSNFGVAIKLMRLALKERLKRFKGYDTLTFNVHLQQSSISPPARSCFECSHIYNDSYTICENCNLKLPQ